MWGRIMQADCSVLTIGSRYSRDDLVRLWGLKGRQAISRGVVTPAGASQIILFVTQHKAADMTEYYDQLVGEALTWEGDGVESHTRRLADQVKNPSDEIHLLFRDTRPEDFIYCGELTMVSADLTHANGRFELRLDPGNAAVVDKIRTRAAESPRGSIRPAVRPSTAPPLGRTGSRTAAARPTRAHIHGQRSTMGLGRQRHSVPRLRAGQSPRLAARSLPPPELRGARRFARHCMARQHQLRSRSPSRDRRHQSSVARLAPRVRVRAAPRARTSPRPRCNRWRLNRRR